MFSRERWAFIFSIFIRFVFLFAFGAFLRASIQHIADFFQTFEGADQSIGYTLAIAIDGTSLVLTAGLMFFKRNMSTGVFVGIWIFIVFLTLFSWVINWQYAVSHQNDAFISHLHPFWRYANPVFASSFAVLNIAYTIVAEAFNRKEKTDEELQAELDELTGPKAQLKARIAAAKAEAKAAQPDLIEVVKEKAIKAKKAALEVRDSGKEETVVDQPVEEAQPASSESEDVLDVETESESEIAVTLSTEMETPVSTDLESEPATPASSEAENTASESESEVETEEETSMSTDMPVFDEIVSHFVDTEEHEKLDNLVNKKRNRNTDQLSSKISSSRNSSVKKPVTKEQKIVQLLSRNPQLNLSEIAEKAGVTRQYVSQIKNKVTVLNQPVKSGSEEMAG